MMSNRVKHRHNVSSLHIVMPSDDVHCLGRGCVEWPDTERQAIGVRKAPIIFFRSLLTMAFDFVIGYDVVVVNALFDYFEGRGTYP